MAELTAFNILTTDGKIIPVTGAAGSPTITPRLIYDGATHPFGLSAGEVAGGMGGAFAINNAGTIVTADDYYTNTPNAGSVLASHDHITLTDPRFSQKLESFMEWWDSATQPGIAGTINFTGVSGSGEVVVPGVGLLTVGQKITTVGDTPIPADTYITDITIAPTVAGVIGARTIYLSKALIANATDVTGTLLGSNMIARILARKYVSHSSGSPTSI